MQSSLVVIKLGGSVITDKASQIPIVRINVIKRLAKELRQILNQGGYRLILVHGGGSFGHPLAKKYSLHKGMKTDQQKLGFCLTGQTMLALNSAIINSLLEEKIPVISLPPRSYVRQSAGRLGSFNYRLIKTYLDNDQVPVLFGDVVLDDRWGCSILSGDTITAFLAQKFHARKVIFLSNVDGIFDSDPRKNSGAKLISEITNSNILTVLNHFTSNNQDDVTGEMAGKILSIKKYLKGIPVIVTNGLKPKNLLMAAGQSSTGTTLLFD